MALLAVTLFPPALRRAALLLAAGAGLLIVGVGGLLVLLLAILGGTPAPPPATSNLVITGPVSDIPADQLAVMQQAAASSSCGLDWSVLAGIARVESGFGTNMATSSAGAIGYGQFLPASWAAFGQGGNPYDFHGASATRSVHWPRCGRPGANAPCALTMPSSTRPLPLTSWVKRSP